MRLSVSGDDSERSHFDTACRDTPRRAASASCESPACLRRSAKRCAISTFMVCCLSRFVHSSVPKRLRLRGSERDLFQLEFSAIIGCGTFELGKEKLPGATTCAC